jgi:GNAT superfamily N-acetyltransferase
MSNGESVPPLRMQLRIARHTEQMREIVAFYRDGLGLSEVGSFKDHDGYNGVFLAVPGTNAHLEFTTGGAHGVPAPHPESLVVLYLGSNAEVENAVDRLGGKPVAAANPYWAEHGVTVVDPDGFRVVLVPELWEPDAVGEPAIGIHVREYDGPRARLRRLFELAEGSPSELDQYIDAGRVLVAVHDDEIIGHVQVTETGDEARLEIKNVAVVPSRQRRGVGRALMTAAIALARDDGCAALIVATAAADIGSLAFYQRLGFRVRSVEHDAFTEATGYSPGTLIDGIELRDRIWLELELAIHKQ